MKIEFQFNSVQIDPQELQEYYPNIIPAISFYSTIQKTQKNRKQKIRKTAGNLIDDIIDSIE